MNASKAGEFVPDKQSNGKGGHGNADTRCGGSSMVVVRDHLGSLRDAGFAKLVEERPHIAI